MVETRDGVAVVATRVPVWEVVRHVQELDVRGAAALRATAAWFDVEVADVAEAMLHYAGHVEEVEQLIDLADRRG